MSKGFKRADKLVGCDEALSAMFVPADGTFFRVVHNPLEKNDELVQNEQVFEGLAPSVSYSNTIEKNSSVGEQVEHVRNWSLSYNVDENKLAEGYWKAYDDRKTEVQKRNFIRRKGDCIAKYDLTPETGLVQKEPDANGHTVHVEYEDFVMEDYRDKKYGFKPLKDFRQDDKE